MTNNPDREHAYHPGPANGAESYRRPVTLAAYIRDVEGRMGKLYTPLRAEILNDAREFMARQEKGRSK